MPDDKQAPCRPRRRWFQFGLRALLLVMLLAAILFTWQRERLARWVESLWPAARARPVTRQAGPAWSSVVSAETLEREIERCTESAAPHMVSKSQWNTGHRKVRKLYTTLMVCFDVIAVYDRDVKYKQDAIRMRDALARSAAG